MQKHHESRKLKFSYFLVQNNYHIILCAEPLPDQSESHGMIVPILSNVMYQNLKYSGMYI